MRGLVTWLVLACASGCSKAADAPDVDEPEEPVEVAEVAPTVVPPKDPLAALDSGVVSRALIGACLEPDALALAALPERARTCGAGLGAEDCARPLPLGIAAFHEDGRVLLIGAPWVDACDTKPTYRLSEVTMPWLHGDDPTTFEARAMAPGGTLWRWLAARLRRGFEPATEVSARYCQYETWASPAHSLVFLDKPLDRWMLTIGRGRKTLPIRLVGPSNQRAFDFDPITLKPGKTCELDEDKKDVCRREMSADVVQVVLAPNRRSLVVTLLIGTPQRCGTRSVVNTVLRLPDGIRRLMPKGDAPVSPDLSPDLAPDQPPDLAPIPTPSPE